MRRLLVGLSLLAAFGIALAGCAVQKEIIQRAERIKTVADEARNKMDDVEELGGPRCGLKELAIADARYIFVKSEIYQGNYPNVRRHLKEGQKNADLAYLKAKACEPPDRDHDGILDSSDKCPDEAEDKDGFQDEDGCPDPDNDKDGILDAEDKCPNDPEDKDGFQDEDGCPDSDNDEDGIPDVVDKCPNESEDKDNFKDEDGCPDLDNDEDGLPDAEDKCPDKPETFNGIDDADGCPDKSNYSFIEVTNKAIEIKDKIYFATGKDTILPKSFPILNEVAKALKDLPQFKVEVGGHTDNRGDKKMNQSLSQRRADSVRKYLIEKGKIDASRLTAIGYGDTQPVATNQTQNGRDKNRRVEFKIVSHDAVNVTGPASP